MGFKLPYVNSHYLHKRQRSEQGEGHGPWSG